MAAALTHWGDEGQQAAYLPPFTGDDVPAAAFALLEPHALFDPFAVRTRARVVPGGYALSGTKALVPRAQDAELLLVAARVDGAGARALPHEDRPLARRLGPPSPAMGCAPPASATSGSTTSTSPAPTCSPAATLTRSPTASPRAAGWCAIAIGTARACSTT